MIKRLNLLLVVLVLGINAKAQSEFDLENLFEIKIFEPDSIASKHNLRSVTEYYQDSGQIRKLRSFKEFNHSYPTKYKKKFLDNSLIAGAEVIRISTKQTNVICHFRKRSYKKDSIFISMLSYNFGNPDSATFKFISIDNYSKAKEMTLKATYAMNDSMFTIRNFINGIPINSEYAYFNYKAPYWKIDQRDTVKTYKKSHSLNDTIINIDTLREGSITGIMRYYRTIFNDPVLEEYTEYNGSELWNKSKIVRTFDRRNRLVNYDEYFLAMRGDTSSLKLFNTKTWKFSKDGGYTIYEGHPRLDKKPDYITRYNKNGGIMKWVKNYTLGGIKEIKYRYNKSGLLLEYQYFLDGKFSGKTAFEYTFNR